MAAQQQQQQQRASSESGDEEDELQTKKELLVSLLSSIKGRQTPNSSPIQLIKKEVAPNLFHTQGIHFIVDGNRYLLSMDTLQEQNVYQLPSTNCKIFSHIPLVEVASRIWDDGDTDEDFEVAARALVDKHFMLSKAPRHLNQGEKTLHFASFDCMDCDK